MANITTTSNSPAGIAVDPNPLDFRDELLTFAGAATILAGTLLARDTTSLKLVPYVKGGSTRGNGVVCCVSQYAVTAAGAGDLPVRPLMQGRVYKKKLVIDADGNDSNIDGTVIDLLRARNILAVDSVELAG